LIGQPFAIDPDVGVDAAAIFIPARTFEFDASGRGDRLTREAGGACRQLAFAHALGAAAAFGRIDAAQPDSDRVERRR
jgi:hypothetical protein